MKRQRYKQQQLKIYSSFYCYFDQNIAKLSFIYLSYSPLSGVMREKSGCEGLQRKLSLKEQNQNTEIGTKIKLKTS